MWIGCVVVGGREPAVVSQVDAWNALRRSIHASTWRFEKDGAPRVHSINSVVQLQAGVAQWLNRKAPAGRSGVLAEDLAVEGFDDTEGRRLPREGLGASPCGFAHLPADGVVVEDFGDRLAE